MDLLQDNEVFELEDGEEMEEEEENVPNTQMEEWKPSAGFSNRAKIIETLKNLHSPEVNIYSHSSKEYIALLKDESGDNFLIELIQLSPNCTELIDAWKVHQNKPGLSHILSLLATILDHPAGKSQNNSIRKNLDNLSRSILTTKLDDIYSELKAQESRRQSAGLNLLASIIKRGTGLASEVAKNFNFKLPIIAKLSGVRKKGDRVSKNQEFKKYTRNAFINFAMSFVESSNPRLLRWIIQQKELFSGVLRKISDDDSDTIIKILSLFRDKILNEEFLIPPGLRSVLFGSATLEQLSYISGNNQRSLDADVAHQVLVMVCTDPRNGLMPGLGLKGNEKRLLDLMKKLKASEVKYHRDLILGICRKNISLCSKYLEEFPYYLDPRPSPSWFSAISLLADIISSLDKETLISYLSSSSSSSQDEKIQLILKCIIPQVCSKKILSKGLQHSDDLVRHASLRIVLESLKIICDLVSATNCVASYIQDEIRTSLPDPQIWLKLLSDRTKKEISKISGVNLKRCAESEPCEVVHKKLKTGIDIDDDIMIGGILVEEKAEEICDVEEKEGIKCEGDKFGSVCKIWGLEGDKIFIDEPIEIENIFHSKLFDVLTLYLRVLPGSFEDSFDFIKILPTDPSNLSKFELKSLLSLLLEFVSPSKNTSEKIPELMYKHLQPLFNILLYSNDKITRDEASLLVRASMISTGAFDRTDWEIHCWLVFVPGFRERFDEIEISNVLVSFLCDSISTVGNNLFKYLDQTRKFLSGDNNNEIGFSPLVLCILQKCIRLLDSDSASFKLHERKIISLYVCNSLSLILQSQVDSRSLAGLINSVITEKFKEYSSEEMDKKLSLCEWTPLKNLLFLSQTVLDKKYHNLLVFSSPKTSSNKKRNKNKSESFNAETINTEMLICAKTEDLIANFPVILKSEIHLPFLASLFFPERDNLVRVTNKWPNLFRNGLKIAKGEIINSDNEDDKFAKYLLEAPFHVLFGTILGSSQCKDLIISVELLDLLKSKLSECSAQELVLYLRFILFWGLFVLNAHISNPKMNSEEKEGLLNSIFSLMGFMFDQITLLTLNSNEIQDLVDFLFEHPLINQLLSCSLTTGDLHFNGGLDEWRDHSEENLPVVNRCFLRFLTKLFGFLVYKGNELDSNSPTSLLEKILLIFREKFEFCIENGNLGSLIPIYHIFRNLMQFIPLSELFSLSNSIFALSETKFSEAGFGSEPASIFAFICLQIGDTSTEILFKPNPLINPFWEIKKEKIDLSIFQKVYYQILNAAINLNSEYGDEFLFKSIERVYTHRYISSDISLGILCSNILTNAPTNLVNYCTYPTSKIKTKILELIVRASPNHLDLFGKLFLRLINKDQSANNDSSEGGFVNLLPVALVYVNKIGLDRSREILVFYSEILLKGFANWKGFIERNKLIEKNEELGGLSENVSFENFSGYFGKTLLGKTVSMLGEYFSLDLGSDLITKKQRFKILDSIFPDSEEFQDSINLESLDEIHAKVSLAKLLLSDKMENLKKVKKFKLRFTTILTNTLNQIMRNSPKKTNLERFVLQEIVEFCTENKSEFNKFKSLPFLNPLIKSSFLHRFEDPITLKAIRCVLISLSEGNFSANEILELLLGHSQFISSLANNSSISYQSTLLQPVPSIFKSLSLCPSSQNGSHTSENRKTELIKLLRVIYHLKNNQNNDALKDESKELVFLLLSIYGATLGDLDLEIINLIKEIESFVGENWGGIAEMDYLYGNEVTRIRDELKSSESLNENQRKFLVRENIPIDSRICVRTVLGFCFERNKRAELFSIENIFEEKFNEEIFCVDSVHHVYDPEYILKFSINCLLLGYLEPIEFCKLGLLAITFMSISSSDDGVRKLGYESLSRLKYSLESSAKSKEKLQIKLLVNYLQNGIFEEWQKIPSLISVFLAESSLALLDPSQSHFFTISKFLLHNLSVNLKGVPLFNSLFQNSSIHFKNDRIWILKLVYCGLNLDEDANIYKRNFIMENLLSFYSSSTSDPESKFLIVNIVKKSIKIQDLSEHLLKKCGLLSWLSSILSLHGEGIYDDTNSSSIMDLILTVINEVLSSANLSEWLQEIGLEQISQISSYLFKILIRDIKSPNKNTSSMNSMLEIIVSTLKLSQKRKIYQPHFTLSLHGLYKLYQNLDLISNNNIEFDRPLELGLDLILTSTPVPVFSHEDKLMFLDIIKWAISASLKLSNKNKSLISEKEGNDSYISKILRWINASIIIGKISREEIKSSVEYHENRASIKTLDSLLDYMIHGGKKYELNEKIGAIILYLEQIVEKNYNKGINNSVLLTICLLLLDLATQTVKEFMKNNYVEIKQLCKKIYCPAETNPLWRWSYYQASRDTSLEKTEVEKLEEEEASRRLLIIFSNAFGSGHLFC